MTEDLISRAHAGIRNCPDHSHWNGERYDALLERVVRDMTKVARRPHHKLPPEIAALFGRDSN
ncbi:hypothetical protein JOF42_002346 [Microbacterium phyllosphaerae]|uniref:Uncharacterized protein n=1 Tax=Microbacterium phyllosphaerae TaxID=124798 RepID=A0ABS4WS10_9MICO|nr:hypothetical protein [Microbacterium phyllosphaerae]